MRPEEFGPFLSALRTEKGMTQAELAEILHVSTAAVSKWERGKCLPELSKLDDIAAALGISILEVLKCRVSEEPVTEETVKEVYTETASLSKAQAKKKMRRWIVVLTAAAVFLVCCRYFPLYRVARVWYPSYYETGEISKLAYIGSAEESHSLRLWSARLDGACGCVWVCYTQEAYDGEGNVIAGSWNVPSLWYLEKTASGEWEVLGIKEHP